MRNRGKLRLDTEDLDAAADDPFQEIRDLTTIGHHIAAPDLTVERRVGATLDLISTEAVAGNATKRSSMNYSFSVL